MIRLIIENRGSDYDGTMSVWYETKVIDNEELEKYLKEKIGYAGVGQRKVIGQEIFTEPLTSKGDER